MLEEKNDAGLEVIIPTNVPQGSAHYPFFQYHIPVLFFYTGTHDQYHQPEDDVELINTEGMVRIGSFAAGVLLDLVSRPERLAGGEFEPDGPGVASRQLQAVN